MGTASSSVVFAVALLLSGCGSSPKAVESVPQLILGEATCVVCGMVVMDPGYAAASRNKLGETRTYDSIECLIVSLRGPDATPDLQIWLADLASGGTLHPVRETTVVLANYPSPMGKGYAAFRDPAMAREEVERRDGVSGSLQGFVDGSLKQAR